MVNTSIPTFIGTNQEPRVALVTACYNSMPYIEEMVDSVLNQSYRNFCFILVNDGSTDETGQIIDDYAIKDARIIALHKSNGGVSSARNAALDLLAKDERGFDFVSFIDSDDRVSSDYVSTFVEYLTEYSANMAFCKYREETKRGLVSPRGIEMLEKTEAIVGNEIFNALFSQGDWKGHFNGWFLNNKMFSYELIKKHRFDEGLKQGEDLEFLMKLYPSLKSICYVPDVLFFYRLRKTSLSHSADKKRNTDIELYRKLVASLINEQKIREAVFFCGLLINSLYKSFLHNIHLNNAEVVANIQSECQRISLEKDICEILGTKEKRKLFALQTIPLFIWKFYIRIKKYKENKRSPHTQNDYWD